MKKRIVRLTESDLLRIVKRVIREDMGGMDDVHPTYGNLNLGNMSSDEILNLGNTNDEDDFGFESSFCEECEGTGCEECDGSGMKRNSVVNNEYKNRSMYDRQGGLDDFDSHRKSNYGRDTKNSLDLNSLYENKDRRFFNSDQKKSGGRPSTVRRRK